MSGSSKKPVAKSTKLRPKVPCYCKICNGKLVDTRTRQKHEAEENRLQASMSMMKSKEIKEIEVVHASGSRDRDSVDSSQIHDDDIVMDHDRSDEEFLTPKPVSIRKRRRRYDRFQKTHEHTMVIPEEEPE
jgi:hypothetical protein